MSDKRPEREATPRRRRGRLAFGLALVTAGAMALLLYRASSGLARDRAARPDRDTASEAARDTHRMRPAATPDEQRDNVGVGRLPDHRTLAPSLAGTDVDGELLADEHGNLVLALGVRDFFDYFLSTVGEIPLEEAIAYMEAYARERLPEKAVQQLLALLDDYMAYRRAAADIYKQPLAPREEQDQAYYLETLDRTFRELKERRREHMSDDAVHAFFSLEEEYGQYTLDRMAIEIDPTLSREEKHALLADLRGELRSDLLRQSEERNVDRAMRARELESILASDGSIEDKRAELAAHHDPDAVERIVDHLAEKRDFQTRMDAYLAARQPLMSLPIEEREPRLAALRQRYFHTEQELIWARTYEARETR